MSLQVLVLVRLWLWRERTRRDQIYKQNGKNTHRMIVGSVLTEKDYHSDGSSEETSLHLAETGSLSSAADEASRSKYASQPWWEDRERGCAMGRELCCIIGRFVLFRVLEHSAIQSVRAHQTLKTLLDIQGSDKTFQHEYQEVYEDILSQD